MNIYHVLESKGILLPSPPPKGGVYTPVKEFGDNFLYCSGCGPDLGNGNTIIGKLGDSLSIEDGQKAAYNCMLNLLANLHAKIVNSTDSFTEQPLVVNGASNLLIDIFGEEMGCPARSAIGTNSLPGGIACEIELIVELK